MSFLIPSNFFSEPFKEMEEMMKIMKSKSGGFIPALDIYEKGDDLIAETSLPNVDAKDVDISIEDGNLVLKGSTEKKKEVEKKNYYRKEVSSGSFYRSIPLPVAVKEDKVTAEFKGNKLTITLPKANSKKVTKVKVTQKKIAPTHKKVDKK